MADEMNGTDALSGEPLLNHSIFEHMRDGVAVYRFHADGSRKLLDCNPSFAAMAGRSKDELLAMANLADVQDCESTSLEDTHIQQCFNSGTPYINTFSWIRPDGQDNIIESQSLPVPTPTGVVLYTINRDITEQKHFEQFMQQMRETLEKRVKSRTLELVGAREQAEKNAEKLQETVAQLEDANRSLKEAQSQLVMQEKLASVGQLAAGLAHELNGPIGFVSSNFEVLSKNVRIFTELMNDYRQLLEKVAAADVFEDEINALKEREQSLHLDFIRDDIKQLLDESREGFRRVSQLISSIREFSHVDATEEFHLYSLNKELQTTLVIAHSAYKNHAQIVTDLADDLPQVRCIPGQINQVLLNLIVNSAQALAESPPPDNNGEIKLKTWADNGSIYCEVSDNGPGILPEHLDQIFHPFFTTKGAGKGTGLGLSISYDIVVHKHNGSLTVRNLNGRGCAFTIRLPIEEKKDGP